ncbi:branched-chain amino acid ABC transporter permease [Mesorhizobium sp. CCNWLW179-1]|uniref:branched-chain amino acid ABC transporter permease n=1 Tax=unclassified Mesorhizobium TaxID=325217 RepID=UPI003014C6C3
MRIFSERSATAVLVTLFPIAFLTTGNSFYESLLIYGSINAIAAIGLCLVFGLGGQISLAQAAFVGIGAYTAALATDRLHLDHTLSILLGGLLAMAVGWLLSRPLSRLSELYLAMATLAFGIVSYIIFANFSAITGGLDPGITISRFTIFGYRLPRSNDFFWVCWGMLVLTAFIASNLASSKAGRALRALKMSEAAAASVGIAVVKEKAFVFAMGAFFAGLSGGLFANVSRSFNAGSFNFNYSIDLLMMVIIGSLSRVSGAILGALIITLLPMVLDNFEHGKTLFFGILIIVIVRFAPDGLIDTFVNLVVRLFRRSTPAYKKVS